ncbi:MAG: DNA polymerase III subunit gamma/tau [Bacteroidales bacterium]|nr:DNA polymerase III subunit gamma/tau [Bacteroidales bacterium]
MSDYIVSARKYRPDSFGTLLGQDNIARTLSNSIKRGQLAHAYLFCGPRGVGKTTTARIFAKMINCANPGADMEPCGECESCVSFQEGRSYCIHELDAASNNSVEDIKALMEQVQVPPQVGKYSVYIIDEVHMLSQAAFNAFLKTLEEPPAHAIFILATTEKHKILPTILSRCQTYDFNRIGIPDMVRNLREIAAKEGVTIDDESLHVIAQKADGAMRDALTIFDQTVAFCGTDVHYEDVIRNLNVLDYEYSFQMVESFLAGDYAAALRRFDEVLAKGFNALHFVAALSSHFRDLAVAKSGALDALLELPASLKQRYAEQASRCSIGFIYEALGVTTACETAYKAAVNPRLHIEFALMKLSFLCVGAPKVAAAAPSAAAPAPAPAPVAAAPAPLVHENGQNQGRTAENPELIHEIDQNQGRTAENPELIHENGQNHGRVEEAPTPRRRVHKTGSALSMNAIMEEKAQQAEEKAEPAEVTLPSDDDVRARWKDMAGMYASKPRLANMLSSAEPRIEEEDGVKKVYFSVVNESQKTWIEDKLLRDMEKKLRDMLTCPKVNILVEVTPDTEVKEKVPYMPIEKAKDLMEKNPNVRELITALSLDTK